MNSTWTTKGRSEMGCTSISSLVYQWTESWSRKGANRWLSRRSRPSQISTSLLRRISRKEDMGKSGPSDGVRVEPLRRWRKRNVLRTFSRPGPGTLCGRRRNQEGREVWRGNDSWRFKLCCLFHFGNRFISLKDWTGERRRSKWFAHSHKWATVGKGRGNTLVKLIRAERRGSADEGHSWG